MMINDRRSTGMFILLNIVTCGIYQYFFLYDMIRDMNIVCDGDGEETPSLLVFVLLSLVTCGIYALYWYYKLGNRQAANAQRYGLTFVDNGTSVLLWIILGMWLATVGYFIAIHILIKNMNALAYAYNNGGGNGGYAGGGVNRGAPNVCVNINNANGRYTADKRGGGTRRTAAKTASATVPADDRTAFVDTRPAAVLPSGTRTLRCVAGNLAGRTFPIRPSTQIIIGRGSKCAVRFSDDTAALSREHCYVENVGGTIYIIDNNSSYGTYLANGSKLEPMRRTAIGCGTGFYLGSRAVMFEVE